MSYGAASNQTADISQHVVQLDLSRRGWIFCVPSSRDARYDVIVDRGKKRFETLQIKTIANGMLRCTTRPLQANERVTVHGKPRNNYHYKDLGIDWIVGVTTDEHCLYYPYDIFSAYTTINVRQVRPVEFGYAIMSPAPPLVKNHREWSLPSLF